MPYKDIEQKRSHAREWARRWRSENPGAATASVLRSRDPAKHRARANLAYAKRTGKIVPGKCEVCGSTDVQAHHDDYTKPLDVRWLCRIHHAQEHWS